MSWKDSVINKKQNQYKILFATSELYPLAKTGGLADVSFSLPSALCVMGHDVRVLMPAYGGVLEQLPRYQIKAEMSLQGNPVKVLESHLPNSNVIILLTDCPSLFGRSSNLYVDGKGEPWTDNALRFALFSRAIAALACNRTSLNWQPDIVHCNDWQTALAPALLHFEPIRPALVFTIHNLAYQGIFPYTVFTKLKLPADLWSFDSMEFHGKFSFIKGGIVYADRVNTVSPTYAKEIQTQQFGCGLHGLLRYVQQKVTGITNGIDMKHWNPAEDPFISQCYSRTSISKKSGNKIALQKELNLTVNEEIPLFSLISRLVDQKGIELIIKLLEYLVHFDVQLAILGSGKEDYQKTLTHIAAKYPNKFAVRIGFDEPLAHRITAGADIFLMPSDYEPCGLNQMYSQRYGTIPIVRNTGGLANTVHNATEHLSNSNEATGFIFQESDTEEFLNTVMRALDLYNDKAKWRKLQENGMNKDFSWQKAAGRYLELYRLALQEK